MIDDLVFRTQQGGTWHLRGDHVTSTELGQGRYLMLRQPSAVPLDDELLNFAQAMQDLLTLASNRAVAVERVTLEHSELVRDLGDGQNTPEELYLIFPHRHPEMSEARPLNVHSFLFGFDDLGGLSGLRTWFDVMANHRPTIGLLLTAHYSPSLYVENRFLNIVGAAEALHRATHPNHVLSKSEYRRRKRLAVASIEESVVRTWVNDALRYANEPRLADRLRDLAGDVGSELGSSLSDVHRWATLVARTRNRLTHIERGPSPVARVAWAVPVLADCTYYVTSAALFAGEADLRPAVSKVLRAQESSRTFGAVPEALNALEQQLQETL